ncbi:hypothetical protein [Streptomyces sp. ALI-76-A]|uniref:hypothetical protein n=1 Tax=Streptomyces sp. ALI-76-A TaxID=3025736 RepID=UPI00256F3695|nr:hypothetical protein [Streptomyces sp. ALI-76-A]MDL5204971.1 hypothetical protein [Streptomyces sp. ALI-76-A]
MYLSLKTVAATNRYVENGPEDRNPSFKHDFRGRVEHRGGILRYSTTSPVKVLPKVNPAAALIRGIAQAGN